MTCERIHSGPSGTFIICSRGRRRPPCSVPGCDKPAERECDFPIPRRKNGTCDANLCVAHAVPQPSHRQGAEPLEYCPPHHKHAQLALKVTTP